MLVCFGDLHLNDERPWSLAVSREIIHFIQHHPLNTPEHTAVFLGDITEKAILTGTMVSLLLSLLYSLKNFKKVYFLTGNHDIKLRKDQYTVPLSFLQDSRIKEQFTSGKYELVTYPKFEEIDGFKVLFLPYPYRPEYEYQALDSATHFPEPLDIMFGHFSDTTQSIVSYGRIDISYIPSSYVCLGHIHTPSDNYIGSIVPNSIAEAGVSRAIWTFSKDSQGKVIKEIIPIYPPLFDFYTVRYPQPLPSPVPAKISAWIIYDCASEDSARGTYGSNIFIHSCKKELKTEVLEIEVLNKLNVKEEQSLNVFKFFDMWEQENYKENNYSPEIFEKARAYLKLIQS